MVEEDTQESLHFWRLKCIRAEAELRASPALPSDGDAAALEPLAEVLALERHLGNLEVWRESALQEQAVLRCRCDETHSMTEDATQRLTEISASIDRLVPLTGDRLSRQRRALEGHERRCRLLLEEASANLSQDSHDEGPSLHAPPSSDFETLGRSERGALELALREREREERLLLELEDVRMQGLDAADAHKNNLRDIAWAKKTIQLRSASLTKAQTEALRARNRVEKASKQVQVQLEQGRADLADATQRAEAVGEQLRKVKQRHGRQLKSLRTTTGGLQQEVDEHLNFLESSAEELEEMRQQEHQLEQARRRHAEQCALLEEQSLALKVESENLSAEMESQRLQWRNGSGRHFAERASLLEEEVQARNESIDNIRQLEGSLQAALAAGEALTAEMEEELSESHSQRAHIDQLRTLQEENAEAVASETAIEEEHQQLISATRALKAASDRHNADIREVEARFQKMRLAHTELAEALRLGPKSYANGSLDTGLARAAKRAEAFVAVLKPPTRRGPNGAIKATPSLGSASSEQLQERLMGALGAEMEAALSAARKRVLHEQQQAIQATRAHTEAFAQARRTRCQLETDLSRVEQRCMWLQSCAEHEQQAVLAQAALLDMETAECAEALAADAESVLLQQASEKKKVLERISILRRQDPQKGSEDDPSRPLEGRSQARRARREGDEGDGENENSDSRSGSRSSNNNSRSSHSSSNNSRSRSRSSSRHQDQGESDIADGEEKEEQFVEELARLRAEKLALHRALVPLQAALLLHAEGHPLEPFLPIDIDENATSWVEEAPQAPSPERLGPTSSGSVTSLSTTGSAPVLQAPPLRPRRSSATPGAAVHPDPEPPIRIPSHPKNPPGTRLA